MLNFSGMGNTAFFEAKCWCKDVIYWLLKSGCIELDGDEKYGPFWGKKLMEIWSLLMTEKFLFWATKKFLLWTFRRWEIRTFFKPKSWCKDNIYLVFLSFPWHSKTWETRFFVLCFLTNNHSRIWNSVISFVVRIQDVLKESSCH